MNERMKNLDTGIYNCVKNIKGAIEKKMTTYHLNVPFVTFGELSQGEAPISIIIFSQLPKDRKFPEFTQTMWFSVNICAPVKDTLNILK